MLCITLIITRDTRTNKFKKQLSSGVIPDLEMVANIPTLIYVNGLNSTENYQWPLVIYFTDDRVVRAGVSVT